MSAIIRKIGMGRGETLVSLFFEIAKAARGAALPLLIVASAILPAFADLYVTPTGAGNKDGSSWANAFAGIQAAVDAVDAAVAADANYAIPTIRVADGTYTRVVVSRNMALDVRSENGAASTIIDGGGTNGCLYVYTGSSFPTAPTFTGFTLQNGDDADLDDYPYYNGGGAGGGTLVDCIVQDCRGWNGGGTFYSDTVRCIVRRCTAEGYGGGVYYGTHRNTLIYGNTAYNRIVYYATLYNCTVADNAIDTGSIRYSGSAYNCVFWGNIVNGAASAQDDAEDPKLVGDGDYRPRVGSPAIDGGDGDYAAAAGDYDLAGSARVQGAAIDRGCYEGPGVEGFKVTAFADGNGAVLPAGVFTNAGAVVTITADISVYNRQVVQWTTNGVTAAWGGDALTLAPLANDVVVTARFEVVEWYVDAENGSDSNPGYDSSAPFKTIQKAVDSAAPYEIIYVMPGVYAPIDTTQRHVDIVGVEGAERTIIDGGGTTRCANLQSSRLTGFTLRNGRSVSTNDQDGGGGAKWGTLVECILENNVANYGGGAYDSHLIRCIVRDNNAGDGGGFFDGMATDCLVIYNSANQGGGARGGPNSSFYNCTFAYNRGLTYGALMEAFVYNSVFYKNRTANHRSNYRFFNSTNCCIDDRDETAPLFVDPENGDFRLRADSPCVDAGANGRVLAIAEWDVRGEGHDRIVGDAVDIGCYEGGIEGFVVSVRTDGHGLVSDRTIVVAEGGSATVTATEDGRAFVKWLVDGEEAGTSTTLTLSNIDADHVVTACFERRTTNVSGGNGALQTAINAAKDGDTLLVAAGTYSAIDATGRVLDIVSASGPATTAIQGKNSLLSKKRAVTFGQTMTRPRCTLTGFTVEGGYCNDYTTGGGGVFGGIVSNCVIRGNGALLGGGGAAYCDLVGCTISDNSSTVMGAGALVSTLESCLVTGNTVTFNGVSLLEALGVLSISDNFGGGGGIAYAAAENCTIVGNTAKNSSGGGAFWSVLNNTYIAGNSSTKDGGNQNFYKCPVRAQPWFVCSEEPEYRNSLGYVDAGADDTFVDAANGDYRLKPGSACVDAGDEDYLEVTNRIDLAGAPRWRANAPDIGCYEIDAVEPTPVSEVSATRSDAREDVEVSWTRTRGSEWYEVLRSETERWADAERIGVATNIASSFVDDTAAYATKYWYWVVSHSDVGDAERDGSASGYWTTPLAITTASLPSGTSPYSKPLAATGGIGPYEWSVYDAKYQFTTNDASTFSMDGVVAVPYEGYYTSSPLMDKWLLSAMPLPFRFPFGGREYTNVWINSDGVVAFGETPPDWSEDLYGRNYEDTAFWVTEEQFLKVPAIAVYTHGSYDYLGTRFTKDSATIVWEGQCWHGGWGSNVRFALTLYPSGEFDFQYGGSEGYNYHAEPYARYGYSTGTGEGFLAVIGDTLAAGTPDRCIRYAPAPAWLTARDGEGAATPGVAAGVISAVPPASTTNEIVVSVADDDGRASYRRFRLVVLSNGSLTGYAAWAALNGLGAADAVTDGQPNLIRYAFNVPSGAFSPFTGISFNASGKPVVTLLPLVNTDGVTVKVLSTTDLTDWSNPEVRTLTISDNGTLIFDHATDPQRFYRLKAE